MNLRYSSVVDSIREARLPVHEIGTAGRAAVTLAAGRIVALAFSAHDLNLFWSNPGIGAARLSNESCGSLPGGLGGDRLWFSPELAYHWDGTPDWQTLNNYKPPASTDPGAYAFVEQESTSVTLRARGELPIHRSDRRVCFQVERTIRIAESPLAKSDSAMNAIEYVGIESSHVLKLTNEVRTGLIALWHLLQVPIGAVLIVPTRSTACAELLEPLSYALPGGWVQKPDHIMWRYGGTANAKFGLSAAAVTGRAAVMRSLDGDRWCMLVRDFPCETDARYCDHPYAIARTDQVFQAWDGGGFGELEFHSPALDAERGPRELVQSNRLWAFGGSSRAIAVLARRLLNVEIDYLFS